MSVAQPPPISIDGIKANHFLYCQTLRILIRQGRDLSRIQRSICWQRLEHLHAYSPKHYQSPQALFLAEKGEAGVSLN